MGDSGIQRLWYLRFESRFQRYAGLGLNPGRCPGVALGWYEGRLRRRYDKSSAGMGEMGRMGGMAEPVYSLRRGLRIANSKWQMAKW
jgi:hypothetical protein